jgi:hypothetical protein
MTSRTDKLSAGNSRVAYVREYKKLKRLEEDNCNNVPKRTILQAERKCHYREIHENLPAEYMRNYRKRRAQENKTSQASTSTDPTPNTTI